MVSMVTSDLQQNTGHLVQGVDCPREAGGRGHGAGEAQHGVTGQQQKGQGAGAWGAASHGVLQLQYTSTVLNNTYTDTDRY